MRLTNCWTVGPVVTPRICNPGTPGSNHTQGTILFFSPFFFCYMLLLFFLFFGFVCLFCLVFIFICPSMMLNAKEIPFMSIQLQPTLALFTNTLGLSRFRIYLGSHMYVCCHQEKNDKAINSFHTVQICISIALKT